MVIFWILAALLLLAAFAWFLPVLMGKPRRSTVDRRRLNLELCRQRREELAGELAGPEWEGLKAELDQDLLDDLTATEYINQISTEQGRGALIAALIAAPLLGLLLYLQLGHYRLADFSAASSASTAAPPELQSLIDRLAERLRQDPGNLKGWMLLGRTYQQTEQYDKAVDAYTRALKLDPDNLDLQGDYAQSLGDAQGGEYTGEPARIAAEILAKNPKHHSALWLAAAASAQAGETPRAIAYLETLRGEFPKDGVEERHLSGIISQLQGESPAPEVNAPATGEHKSIRVKVSLAQAFQGKAASEDALFIFARAASGPPMPLAIVRRQVKDLPVEVTLDDSMEMAQGMSLSAFDRLVIGARISRTGQALPQPGDLQGLTQPMEIENGGHYAVEINEEIR